MADRAVSEVLSFALVFSLIVASIILVSGTAWARYRTLGTRSSGER